MAASIFSSGFALRAFAAMKGISDLMNAADQAIYDAKRAGRNRVICCISRDVTSTIAAQYHFARSGESTDPYKSAKFKDEQKSWPEEGLDR